MCVGVWVCGCVGVFCQVCYSRETFSLVRTLRLQRCVGADFQNNANPFVDHPEYASMIWNPVTDTEAPTAATNLVASNPTVNSIDLSWTAGTDNIAVSSYDIYVDGANTVSTSSTTITVTGLSANTEFCFTVFARDAALNTAPSSNESCETTNEGTSTPNEIFISEYVEGSSNNKAIEIANFTGNSINLSQGCIIFCLPKNKRFCYGWGKKIYNSFRKKK